MQIRTRLTIQFVGIVAVILVISFIVLYFFSAQYRKNHFYDGLRKKANTIGQLLVNVDEVTPSLLKIIYQNKKDLLTSENITVYNGKNEPIYKSNDSIHFDTTGNLLRRIRTEGELRWQQGDFKIIGIVFGDKTNGIVITAGAIDTFGESESRNLIVVMIVFLIVILGVVGISGWIYAGNALRPINKIVDKVEDISVLNLNARLDEGNKKDEIALLSTKFNKMLDRLEASFQLQKTFVANASHELKNPLTIITSQLEVILLRERTPEDYKKTIVSVLDDIRGLNEVSLRLLDLAKLNSDEIGVNFKPTRVDELLWQCKDELQLRESDYKISFSFDLPDDEHELLIMGNEYLLKTVFINLMDNACKFSSDKEVIVTLKAVDKKVKINFKDKGIGISESDLPNIFEPFYRATNVRSIEGHGIGLSLVEKITKLHKATISVTSKPGEGSSFLISIPAVR
jgi:signal transduction histidine kinase